MATNDRLWRIGVIMKKTLSLLLSIICLFTAFACREKTNNDVVVWTIDATQKILQDKEYNISNVKSNITVSAAKNEYEGWQLIITSKGNVKTEYTITASDLISESGDKYEAKNVAFFHELYIEVAPNEYYTDEGYYPDAILPMEKAVEYKENYVKPSENQGVYIEFYIPKGQKTGKYYGSYTVCCENQQFDIPVVLDVWDFEVSDTTTAKSLFLTKWDYWTGELDTSQEMYKAYIDSLLNYRLCTNDLLLDNDHSAKCISEYTELAYEYAKNPRCSTISIPFRTIYTNKKYDFNGKEISLGMIFDEEVMKDYIRSFVAKSAETGVNIVEKSVVYFTIIDEPQLNKTQGRTKYVTERFTALKKELSIEILNDDTIAQDKITREKLAQDVLDISNVVTSYYEDEFEGLEIDYCPCPDMYDSEGMREKFANNEKWWYCCVSPNYPYPTYHIDDHLLSTRVLYWMASEYEVKGNLNWAVNSYSVNGTPEDFYMYAQHGQNRSGEGFLYYPGAKYGIFGPVASLRLQAYRDGIEEYEMLEGLKIRYEGAGLTAQSIIKLLGSSLYSGTRWATTESNFYNTRSVLATLNEMSSFDDGKGVYISNIVDSGRSFNCVVFALSDANVYVNGQDINQFNFVTRETVNNGILYNINLDKSTFNSRTLKISTTINGVDKGIDFDLGGEISVYDANYIENDLAVYNNSNITFEKVSAIGVGSYENGELIKLNFEGSGKEEKYSIELTPEFIDKISNGCKQMEFVFYTDEAISYEISFLYKQGATVAGRPIYMGVLSGTLTQGENAVKLPNLDSYNWAKYVGVQKILITFNSSTSQDVFLREIVLTEA